MKLYLKYLKIHFMSQMEYRTAFILLTIGQFFVPFLIFVSMVLLFKKFDHLMGWTLPEVALIYGIIHISFSVSEGLARGFDSFSNLVRTGDFDRLLVRPRSTVIQVLGSKFEFTRLGRFFQSLVVLTYALLHINIHWTFLKILYLMLIVLSGITVFIGIFILGAALSFWTVDGLEIVNIFTDGGREMAQYPLGIYSKFIKRFFTFVIPFGLVNFYPILFLLEKSDKSLYAISPFFALIFIMPCLLIWQYGVTHYTSTGS
ncbi:MAG: ABC-2 family transporter protein [Clostridia bacterium]|nr:ABC-2 family transporter protein [Clostridia bacterium]